MESDPENADEADEIPGTIKNPEMENKSNSTSNARNKMIEKKLRMAEFMFDSSDSDNDDSNIEKKKTEAQRTVASRHSKVFFENEDKNIFSIYRCLLHNKKVFSMFIIIIEVKICSKRLFNYFFFVFSNKLKLTSKQKNIIIQ